MIRNAESHFANVPSIDIQRSKMKIPFEHKTSWNVGEVIPIYCSEILPGDTVKMTHSAVIRLQTMLKPVMDNLIADFYWFFEPNRLVMNHWKEFMRENTSGPWTPQVELAIPTISSPVEKVDGVDSPVGFESGTIADYLGLPVGVSWKNTDRNAVSALPFRGYADICNEFFRDENVSYPLNIPKGDANQIGTNGDSYITDVANGGKPFVASRTHDYFSSGLPSAQKATAPVTFPLISGEMAPVISTQTQLPSDLRSAQPLMWYTTHNKGRWQPPEQRVVGIAPNTGYSIAGLNTETNNGNGIAPLNLWADLTSSVGSVTVNELRLAFQLQKFYERQAVSGSRYTETIRSMFGVTSPDARLQRPEYLGGNRIPIVIDEVTNSSETSESPLGNLGAKSNTSDVNVDFEHSFTEHGYLFGLVVVRVANHTYSQGIEKHWLRKTWSDFYWPVFAHIGEMPIHDVNIYADGNMDSDDVFAYQEAWAEYRYMPNRTSGEMRPGISNSLASWHFGDYYTETPILSDTWIREPKANVDRTLAVTSAVSNQLFGDFYFDAEYTRPMPVYSVPGLIDHF